MPGADSTILHVGVPQLAAHGSATPLVSADDRQNQPLRIVMTVNAAWNIWNFRRTLAEGLLADGHEVTVLAPEDDFVPALKTLGCQFKPLPMDNKGLNPAIDAALAWRLRRQLVALQPDAVLSFTIKNNIYGAFAASSLGIPCLPNITGLGTAFLSGGMLQSVAQSLYRSAFARLPVILFQNPDDRELFLRHRLVRTEQARLLPGSGIDLEHFAPTPFPAPDQPVTFLMIARLLRDKGVLEFVEAARGVRQAHGNVRFQLLGAADTMNRTAISIDTLRQWEISHGIEYLGVSQDVRIEIAKAHCVVLPSYREGAPRTLIEAAAMARPVIASDVPGCRTVVADQDSGFLCQPRSSQSLMEACLRFLRLDPNAQAAMGENGRRKMEEEFDQAIVLQVYREVLARSVAEAALARA